MQPQMMKIAERINNDIEVGRYRIAVFFDVLKIFDKIWHNSLLYKIKNGFSVLGS